MRERFFLGLQNFVSVERMERVRHPKSFTMDVRDGEDERRHVHARKEAQTTLWNSIYHSLSSSFVNGRSESPVVKMWESRRTVPHGVAVRTSPQAEDIDEQTVLQLMRKSVVELDPLSKATECPSEFQDREENVAQLQKCSQCRHYHVQLVVRMRDCLQIYRFDRQMSSPAPSLGLQRSWLKQDFATRC